MRHLVRPARPQEPLLCLMPICQGMPLNPARWCWLGELTLSRGQAWCSRVVIGAVPDTEGGHIKPSMGGCQPRSCARACCSRAMPWGVAGLA